MSITSIQENIESVVSIWSLETATRLQQRAPDPADIATLKDVGMLLSGVLEAMGGVWQNAQSIEIQDAVLA
jgi:hypothetical protein